MIAARVVFSLMIAGGGMSSALSAQSSGRDFLFGEPKGSVVLRGGGALAAAGGDLFSFTARQLTLSRDDFRGLTADIDLAIRLAPSSDVVFLASYAGVTRGSEFRDFIDQSDNPIRQSTSFRRMPLMIGVRQYLTPRGRRVGNFAWIPARVAPYVGAGAGAVWYQFTQTGDFVDFDTNEVFAGTLATSGWAPAANAAAGIEFTVTPRLAVTGQGNYLWARARPGGDFSGFNRIDLSALSTSVGLLVRF